MLIGHARVFAVDQDLALRIDSFDPEAGSGLR